MYQWQCKKCGAHPNSFISGIPSRGICQAGSDHVWMRVPAGRNYTKDWQCMHCGKNPNGFESGREGSRPSDLTTCPTTGFRHVWEQI